MTPAMFMFSPEWRDGPGNLLNSWFPIAQMSTWWTDHPHHNRRKVAIKMGIKIHKHLKQLVTKTRTWPNISAEQTCANMPDTYIQQGSEDLDCF